MAFEIGAEAIDRDSFFVANYTLISKDLPASAGGRIVTLEIWAKVSLVGCRVGTFYVVAGDTLKCRDSALIGAVASGSKKVFAYDSDGIPLEIAVEEDDYIGLLYTGGEVERVMSGFAGLWTVSGEYIDPGDEAAYTLAAGHAVSLHGYSGVVFDPGRGRVIFDMSHSSRRTRVKLAGACLLGDVLGWLDGTGWTRALAGGSSVIQGRVVALEEGSIGDFVPVSHAPVLEGYKGMKEGGDIYLDPVRAGSITQEKPIGSGEVDTLIGLALTATRVRFFLVTHDDSVVP